jgi:hypothetical protein
MEQVLGEPAGQRRTDGSWIEAIHRAGRELEDSLTDPDRLKELTNSQQRADPCRPSVRSALRLLRRKGRAVHRGVS